MLVVDTNILAAYLLGGSDSDAAADALHREPVWIAPPIWRSELRSVLRKHMQVNGLSLQGASEMFARAELLLGPEHHPVDTAHVLALAAESGCSTYDCEYVSLAMQRDVGLPTMDRQVLQAFPGVARGVRSS
jgi:predicted nucleic acid-binding protein